MRTAHGGSIPSPSSTLEAHLNGPSLWVLPPDSAAFDTTKTLEFNQFFSSPDAAPIIIVVLLMVGLSFLFKKS